MPINSLPPLRCLAAREGVNGPLREGDSGGVEGVDGPEPAGLNVKFGRKLAVWRVRPTGGCVLPKESVLSGLRRWFSEVQFVNCALSGGESAGNTKWGLGSSSTGPQFSCG